MNSIAIIRTLQLRQQARNISKGTISSGTLNVGILNVGILNRGTLNVGQVVTGDNGQTLTYKGRDPVTGDRILQSADGGTVRAAVVNSGTISSGTIS